MYHCGIQRGITRWNSKLNLVGRLGNGNSLKHLLVVKKWITIGMILGYLGGRLGVACFRGFQSGLMDSF